ncbi:MAG: alpha-L-fucosidase [Nakamurella sp.]
MTKNCSNPKVTAARDAAQQNRSADESAFWQVKDVGCTNLRGDILKDYITSARKAGMKVGIYLSPADGSELPPAFFKQLVAAAEAKVAAGQPLSIEEQATYDDRANQPAGQARSGSGSAISKRTIPTLVPNDNRAAALAAGELPKFTVNEDDYNAYYLNLVYELFTQYGPIDEFWLDGANPWSGSGVSENYDFTAWFTLIHKLSPNTVTFAGPAGVRWIGNEEGAGRNTEWSSLPTTGDPNTAHNEGLFVGGAQATDLGSRQVLADPSVRYLEWAPAESDVKITPGWFYHDGDKAKTAQQLVGTYRNTVGKNASMLLNVPPATDGKFQPDEIASLAAFGKAIKATQKVNLARPAAGTPASPALIRVTDDSLATSWSMAKGALEGTLDIPLAASKTFDQIRLGEDIRHGQHVEGAVVQAEIDGAWKTLGTVTTIGYTRLITLTKPVTTDHLRVIITQSRAKPYLATVALYKAVAPTS